MLILGVVNKIMITVFYKATVLGQCYETWGNIILSEHHLIKS